jgi:Peptidase C13 family
MFLTRSLAACGLYVIGLTLLLASAPPLAAISLAEPSDQLRLHAVLVAADGSLPVWDNAVEGMAALLRQGNPAEVRRYSASRRILASGVAEPATLKRVLDAIGKMRPKQGEGCLVYVTAHGAPQRGLAFVASDNFLTPQALNAALRLGCGEAPTIAILSGCFSGNFARTPMTRPNRIVLTAARADRPSFGCDAGRELTVYDECLLRGLRTSTDWRGAAAATASCVSRQEAALGEQPSEPQQSFGATMSRTVLPWRSANDTGSPPGKAGESE